jgi:hypothetical protein
MRRSYRHAAIRFFRGIATRDSLKRISTGLLLIGFIIIYAPTANAAGPSDDAEQLYELQTGTGHYDPDATCGQNSSTTNPASSSVSFDNAAAEAVAKSDSTGGVNVGYALYDSTGKLVANYNDAFENYGASITKAMLLVAYLNQVGSGTLSDAATSDLTGMIEQSDDNDANLVYGLLNNPQSEVEAVATKVGMTGFKYNDTADSLYVLGQSQITANDFAKFFSQINSTTMFPTAQRDFALKLLANITPNAGLLQAGLPGTVYSKEGWKPEPGGGSDPTRVSGANPNPFELEGAPYVVNQAAYFSSNNLGYGLAVTVSGITGVPPEPAGEGIINAVGSALVNVGATGTQTASGGCTCSATTVLVGNDNQEKSWNYLISLGLSDEQAAGVMGNIMQESSFDPERIQGGGDSINPSAAGSGGYGLVQWTPGGKLVSDLSDAKISGAPYQLATQLDLIGYEMKNTTPVGYSDLIKALEQIKDAGAAALFFDQNFEDGSDPGGIRETYAQQILQKYAGTTSTVTPGDSGGCSSSSASPDCTSAAGVAKILCAAKRYDPASYSESAMGNHYPGGNPQWIKQVCPAAANAAATIPTSCYLDCSGLVNIAVYDAFGYNLEENTVSEYGDTSLWKHIPFSQVQPGDLIQPGMYFEGGLPQHVEIIDHVSGDTIYTFGAHDDQVPQPEQVGPASYQYNAGDGDVFLHWVGPTS